MSSHYADPQPKKGRWIKIVLVALALLLFVAMCSALTGGNDPSPSSSPEITTAQLDQPAAEKSAVVAAERYLDAMPGFSRDGLIEQMTVGSGFSVEEATYAADNVEADWNQQAAYAAQRYQDTVGGFSREGLIDQLVMGSKFTQEQAEFGVNEIGL